ncbi:YegP family protein [Cellulomonas sp. HZM]|uniref:YegP family protein n=1 Tax=Cellulomonas sp. HZM TaxID=1454010 RepID=UPI000A811C59|nr:YegP family protein [Cellulomonas sp. HZM]
MKFEIVKSDNGKYFFRIVASNGNTLAHSQQYESRSSAVAACESIQQRAASATIVDTSA